MSEHTDASIQAIIDAYYAKPHGMARKCYKCDHTAAYWLPIVLCQPCYDRQGQTA